MPRDRIVEVAVDRLPEHPAVEAWAKLVSTRAMPQRLFVLKPEKKRSAVYRMEGVGPGNGAVIAKRGRSACLAIELLIYGSVLPHLPIPTLRCYGSIEDPQPGFGWLFLEDAGEQKYSAENGEHRTLAGRWLGMLHASLVGRPGLADCLPARTVQSYRSTVSLARDALCRGLTNPALGRADVATLESILSFCDLLESQWTTVEGLCTAAPDTLVHGDFGEKNVRVRSGSNGLELLPLDWDSAGWGVAAPDLSQADVAAYWSIARTCWPQLELAHLAQLASIGSMFLALESITGEVEPLQEEWVDNVMRKMRAYKSVIGDALVSVGWVPS